MIREGGKALLPEPLEDRGRRVRKGDVVLFLTLEIVREHDEPHRITDAHLRRVGQLPHFEQRLKRRLAKSNVVARLDLPETAIRRPWQQRTELGDSGTLGIQPQIGREPQVILQLHLGGVVVCEGQLIAGRQRAERLDEIREVL